MAEDTNNARHPGAPDWAETARSAARAKLRDLAARKGATFLHATVAGQYPDEPAWYWTSGFWPGLLRLLLNEGEDPELERLAREAEDRLYAVLGSEDFHELHHDVGFQFLPTSVMRYRQRGNADARTRGIVAAHLLMGRFNAAGQVIEAWNVEERRGFAIIDTVMNLSLLFWASETTGEPRYANLARTHLEKVRQEFVRPDFTTHHIVEFDQTTGARRTAHGGQGDAPDSAWSRGMAWAVYGHAIAARYTSDDAYRETARRVADAFLALNAPHGVPPWDFRAPDAETAPRDSSAAAIVACGLLELADGGDPAARGQAEDLLRILLDRCATFDRPDEEALLRHATSSLPNDIHVDAGIVYGDYFFYEALQRLGGIRPVCW